MAGNARTRRKRIEKNRFCQILPIEEGSRSKGERGDYDLFFEKSRKVNRNESSTNL